MQQLERLGVVERVDTLKDPPPKFTCSVVLVAQGQTGQDFRACANVPDVNHRTIPPVHPLPHCQEMVDDVGQSPIHSATDIKAGFNNVKLKEGCE